MAMTAGYDDITTAMSLAKQWLSMCSDGHEDIIIPKSSLKIICGALAQTWHAEQDRKRSELKKAQV